MKSVSLSLAIIGSLALASTAGAAPDPKKEERQQEKRERRESEIERKREVRDDKREHEQRANEAKRERRESEMERKREVRDDKREHEQRVERDRIRHRPDTVIIRDERHGHHRRHDHYDHRRHDHYDSYDSDDTNISCAGEVVEGNVAATERILSTLAKSEEMANATKFQTEVNSLLSTRNSLSAEAKMKNYFSYLNIDAKNVREVYAFIGAREIESRYIDALVQNLDLSQQQAELVATKLQEGLLGGLSR